MKKRRRSSLPFSNSARAKANAKTLTFHNKQVKKVIAPHKQCNKLKWDNTFWTKLAVDTMAAHEKKKQSKAKTKPSSSSISLSPCSSISSYDSEEIFHRREKARARRAKARREQQQQERKKNKKMKMKKKPIVIDVSSDSDEDEVDIHTLIVIKNAAKKKKRKVTFVDVLLKEIGIVRKITDFGSLCQTARLLQTCHDLHAAEQQVVQGYRLLSVCNFDYGDGLILYEALAGPKTYWRLDSWGRVSQRYVCGVSRWLACGWLNTSEVKQMVLPCSATDREINRLFGNPQTSGRFSKLRILNLDGCQSITDKSLTKVTKSCHQLQSLILSGCSNVTNTGLHAIGGGCSHLKSLDLTLCTKITNLGIDLGLCDNGEPINCGFFELQTLSFRECHNITTACLMLVAQLCPHLQSLDLGECENVTDVGVTAVARRCPNLQTLDLENIDGITDDSLIEVARGCPHLKSLRTYCGPQVTGSGLTKVAQGCQHLQTLHTSGQVTDGVMMDIAQRCSHLKTLSFQWCSKITNCGLTKMARECNNLETLDIMFCKNITDKIIHVLQRSCPELELEIEHEVVPKQISLGDFQKQYNRGGIHVHVGIYSYA